MPAAIMAAMVPSNHAGDRAGDHAANVAGDRTGDYAADHTGEYGGKYTKGHNGDYAGWYDPCATMLRQRPGSPVSCFKKKNR